MNLPGAPSCPFLPSGAEALRFPVGQLHRVAATPSRPAEVDETKRNVLKLLAVAGVVGAAGGGLVGGSLQFAQPPVVGLTSYPKVALADLDGSPLTVNKVLSEYNIETAVDVSFNYPLTNEPNFLLNLASGPTKPGVTNLPSGIGPKGTIVAYSGICQHLGCPIPALSYYPPGTCAGFSPGGRDFYIHCSCHGSTYDVANSAANLTGPAVIPLPQVVLESDSSGQIYATGVMGAPVNGHFDTLKGGYGVGATSALVKQNAVITCPV